MGAGYRRYSRWKVKHRDASKPVLAWAGKFAIGGCFATERTTQVSGLWTDSRLGFDLKGSRHCLDDHLMI